MIFARFAGAAAALALAAASLLRLLPDLGNGSQPDAGFGDSGARAIAQHGAALPSRVSGRPFRAHRSHRQRAEPRPARQSLCAVGGAMKRTLLLSCLLLLAACSRSEPSPLGNCPALDAGSPVDPLLLAFLSRARSAHHLADDFEGAGDLTAAPRRSNVSSRARCHAPTAQSSLPRCAKCWPTRYARLADLHSRQGAFDRALEDVQVGPEPRARAQLLPRALAGNRGPGRRATRQSARNERRFAASSGDSKARHRAARASDGRSIGRDRARAAAARHCQSAGTPTPAASAADVPGRVTRRVTMIRGLQKNPGASYTCRHPSGDQLAHNAT